MILVLGFFTLQQYLRLWIHLEGWSSRFLQEPAFAATSMQNRKRSWCFTCGVSHATPQYGQSPLDLHHWKRWGKLKRNNPDLHTRRINSAFRSLLTNKEIRPYCGVVCETPHVKHHERFRFCIDVAAILALTDEDYGLKKTVVSFCDLY